VGGSGELSRVTGFREITEKEKAIDVLRRGVSG